MCSFIINAEPVLFVINVLPKELYTTPWNNIFRKTSQGHSSFRAIDCSFSNSEVLSHAKDQQ